MRNPLDSITGTLVLGLIFVVVGVVYAQLFRAVSGGEALLVVTLLLGVIYFIGEWVVISKR